MPWGSRRHLLGGGHRQLGPRGAAGGHAGGDTGGPARRPRYSHRGNRPRRATRVMEPGASRAEQGSGQRPRRPALAHYRVTHPAPDHAPGANPSTQGPAPGSDLGAPNPPGPSSPPLRARPAASATPRQRAREKSEAHVSSAPVGRRTLLRACAGQRARPSPGDVCHPHLEPTQPTTGRKKGRASLRAQNIYLTICSVTICI